MQPFRFFRPPADIDKALKDLKTKPPAHWEKLGEKKALALFEYAYRTVPAYKKFLKEHSIDGSKIKTIEDFKTLPVMDKNNYLRKYEYRDLFPNRDVSKATTISATSGSTGEPFYFPRGEEQDAQYEYIAELFLKNQFEIDKKSTLGVIGFGLGIWIGGIFTYKNFNKIASKGYKLALAPVGPNIDLCLKTIKKFGKSFDQVLLMGYPPLVKDIIDRAGEQEVDWRDYRIKIMTATEGFSEEFRQYIAGHASVRNPLTDTLNIYGTVELGTMAHETPIANLIRKIAVRRSRALEEIFPRRNQLPTLAQYHPGLTYFEETGGQVIGSGFGSSIPLLRYNFPDSGGVIWFEEMAAHLKSAGADILTESRKTGIEHTIMRLPFVYVYERADSTITVRGVNIYAEHIRRALQGNGFNRALTGRFTLFKREDRKMNEYFEVHAELKKPVRNSAALARQIQEALVAVLRKINSEYNDQYSSVPKIMTPPVFVWPYQHPLHFTPGIKQKWAKKDGV